MRPVKEWVWRNIDVDIGEKIYKSYDCDLSFRDDYGLRMFGSGHIEEIIVFQLQENGHGTSQDGS